MNLYSMSWQTPNISWLIVATFFCHNPESYMLEFDFRVLILHLTSSYTYVNNLMHIPANYSCDSWAVLLTRFVYYYIYAFSIETQPWTVLAFAYVFSGVFAEYVFSIVFAVCVFFLLKCDYLFCNYPLSLFVILRLELHVYIMLTFMFCEINDIYSYQVKHNTVIHQ